MISTAQWFSLPAFGQVLTAAQWCILEKAPFFSSFLHFYYTPLKISPNKRAPSISERRFLK